MKKQQGFTLIELMIVIAIIAILAAIALPAYQDYVGRSQLTEALTLAGGQKGAMSETKANTGNWPADNTAAGVAAPADITGKYVEKVTVAGNLVTATMKSSGVATGIVGKTLTLTGTENAGSYSWTCTSNADPKFLPAACR